MKTSASREFAVCPWGPDLSDPITLTTEANDPDGDELTYAYATSGGTIVDEGTHVTWNRAGLDPGIYTIKVEVTDGHGGSASKNLNVYLEPAEACRPPRPFIHVFSSDIVDKGQYLHFEVRIEGLEPDIHPTYEWSVSEGEILSGQGTPRIEISTFRLGGHQVKATVKVGGLPPECQSDASSVAEIRIAN